MADAHSLGGGPSSTQLAAAQADLDAFPTSNVYDGGCSDCACEIPIILTYEDDNPVPDAEFVVKWGQPDYADEGEIIEVKAETEAQQRYPEIKGVVDANGLARVKNSPCGSYVILFGEGSDAMEPEDLKTTSELYIAIEEATRTAVVEGGLFGSDRSVSSLSPKGRGELMWWISHTVKEGAAEDMIRRIKAGEVTDKTEVTSFFKEHGAPMWTGEDGAVDEDKKQAVFDEIAGDSVSDIAEDNWFWFKDGALDRLEDALEDQRKDFGYPDDEDAYAVARSLETLIYGDDGRPNERFYKLLQNIKQAEQVAAQLHDPDSGSSGWDVFLLVAEVILGFVPVVGDVVDVVNIIEWLHRFSGDEESPNEWDYVELGALSLGFIPAAGAILKKTFAPIASFFAKLRGAKKFTGNAHQLLQETIKALRKIGDGNLIKWLRKKTAEVKGYMSALYTTMEELCTAVVGALKKYIANSYNPINLHLARRLLTAFEDFQKSASAFLGKFFDKVDDLVADFIAKIANKFVGSAGKEIKPTQFKLRRRQADGTGGLGGQGNGEKIPEGFCPTGLKQAMGSNPVNMISGLPFQNETDFADGLLILERTWTPGQGGGVFGPHWSTPLSSFIQIDGNGAAYRTAMGRKIPFDVPVAGAVCVNVHAEDYELIEYGKGFAVRDANNVLWIYEAHDGMVRRLSSVRDDNGTGYDIAYVPDAERSLGLKPVAITLTNGIVYGLEVRDGRLRRLTRGTGPQAVPVMRYAYDERGMLAGATDAAGCIIGYSYDKKRRLIGLDYNGAHTTRYTYDAQGRVIAVSTDTEYFNDRFAYSDPDESGQRHVTMTDTLGGTYTVHLDAKDAVVQITDKAGAKTAFAYNDGGDIIAETDPLGRVSAMDWDRFGNLTKRVMPDGTVEAFERDGRGRLLSYTDAVGAVWSYERDGRGNVTAEIWPDGRVWRYGLNGRGQPERITNPDGTTLVLEYDARHRLARWTDALGAQTTFAYDAMGRLRERVEPDGTASTFSYDVAGRLTAATLADGRVLSWAWSARGDLIRATDGEGKAVTRDYGPYGLLERITDPKGGTIRFERDKLMRLTGVYNELGERYSYVYDAAGRVMAETDFSGRTLTYAYDIAGRLTEKTAGDGIRTTYAHDRMDRLTQVEIFDRGAATPPSVTRYAYDPRGLMTEAQNRDATVALERDILGRVTRESVNGRSVESTYNDKGELAARDFDGRIARYAYDANGLMSALAIGGHAPLDFERDIMGRERMRRSGAGFAEARLWDRLGQLRAQAAGRADGQFLGPQLSSRDYWDAPEAAQGGAGVARSYNYDRAFNPTKIVDARWGAARYDYDANDQITKAAYEHAPGAGLIEERFTYDAARNIATESETTRGASLSLGEAEPTATTRAAYTRTPGGRIERRGDTTYAYDDQGRMVSKRVERNGFRPQKWRYDWDGEDQLRRVHTPDEAIWEYAYDPFGRRIGKRCVRGAGGKTARDVAYLWAGNLLSEERRLYADGTEQTVAYHYEQGSFRPIAQEVDGTLAYIVTDHLGTPKELLTEDGEVLWSAKHELWGKVRAVQHLRAANDNAGYQDCLLRFQGQIEDEETGLYYNRFRYYDPASGNYVSSDPIGLRGGVRPNGYVYNPRIMFDSIGLTGEFSPKVITTGTIYRLGSGTSSSLTPRPLKDIPSGLSASPEIPNSAGSSYVALDVEKLNNFDIIQDKPNHVAITPKDTAGATLEEWAQTRGSDAPHPLTQELSNAGTRYKIDKDGNHIKKGPC